MPQLSESQSLQAIASCLNRIASCMEAAEKRERERSVPIESLQQVITQIHDHPEQFSQSLWKAEVATGATILGYSEWLAWIEHKEEVTT